MGDKAKGSRVLLRLDYFDLLRDWPAAIMLSQIAYWYRPGKHDGLSKLRVFKAGQWWIVKSHRGWWDDCRLTRRQVDRAINLLVEHKLIEVRVMRYGKDKMGDHGPPPVRHIRSLVLHPQVQSTIAPTGALTDCTYKCNGTTIEYVQKNTAENTLAITSQEQHNKLLITQSQEEMVSDEDVSNKGVSNDKSGGVGSEMEMEVPVNSSEVLGKLQVKKKPVPGYPTEKTVKNATELGMWWSRLVPYYHDLPPLSSGLKLKPLTQKDIGMLSTYLKAVGREHAYGIMRWAIVNWCGTFPIDIKEKTGETLATLPRIGALLKHYDIAAGSKNKGVMLAAAPNANLKMLSDVEKKAKLLAGK